MTIGEAFFLALAILAGFFWLARAVNHLSDRISHLTAAIERGLAADGDNGFRRISNVLETIRNSVSRRTSDR